MYLIHLGYLGYDQDAQTAFIPNEEIRQELTAATRRNPKNISVSLRNYNKNIADKTVLSSRKDENTMKYDFTTILDRKGKDSIAVEPFEADWIKWPGKTKEGFDIIPMWGLLLTVLNDKPITAGTKTIRLKVQAEEGFHPQTDMDISSLRFGASEEVNYGRGSKVLKTENDGDDLIITFDGKGNGITEKEFAPKLIGRYKNGKMLYGYARLPYVDYVEPILSARAPVFSESQKGWNGNIEVQNFGQVSSQKASVKIEYKKEGKMVKVASAAVPALKPYEKADIRFATKADFEKGEDYNFLVTIYSGKKVLSTFRLNRKVVE